MKMHIQTRGGVYRVTEVQKNDGPLRICLAVKEGEEGEYLLAEIREKALIYDMLSGFFEASGEGEDLWKQDLLECFPQGECLWLVFSCHGQEPLLEQEEEAEAAEEREEEPGEKFLLRCWRKLFSHADKLLMVVYWMAVAALWGLFVWVLVRPPEAPKDRKLISEIGTLAITQELETETEPVGEPKTQ